MKERFLETLNELEAEIFTDYHMYDKDNDELTCEFLSKCIEAVDTLKNYVEHE